MKNISLKLAPFFSNYQAKPYKLINLYIYSYSLALSFHKKQILEDMDSIIGFITDLTGEKRGPSKHYRRYNVLTVDNEIIQGWVFSSLEIDQTTSGNVLLTAANTNKSVRLQGKLSTEASKMYTYICLYFT